MGVEKYIASPPPRAFLHAACYSREQNESKQESISWYRKAKHPNQNHKRGQPPPTISSAISDDGPYNNENIVKYSKTSAPCDGREGHETQTPAPV